MPFFETFLDHRHSLRRILARQPERLIRRPIQPRPDLPTLVTGSGVDA